MRLLDAEITVETRQHGGARLRIRESTGELFGIELSASSLSSLIASLQAVTKGSGPAHGSDEAAAKLAPGEPVFRTAKRK